MERCSDHDHRERSVGALLRSAEDFDCIVIARNALYHQRHVADQLGAEPPATNVLVLDQAPGIRLDFLGPALAAEPRELLPLARSADFPVIRGERRPLLLRTNASRSERVILCALELERGDPDHMALLENMIAFCALGRLDVVTVVGDSSAGYEAVGAPDRTLTEKLRLQGAHGPVPGRPGPAGTSHPADGVGQRAAANWSAASSACAPYTAAGPPPIITATPIVSAISLRLAPAARASCT